MFVWPNLVLAKDSLAKLGMANVCFGQSWYGQSWFWPKLAIAGEEGRGARRVGDHDFPVTICILSHLSGWFSLNCGCGACGPSLGSFYVNPGAIDSLGLTRRPQETARPRPRPRPPAGEDGRPRPRTAKRDWPTGKARIGAIGPRRPTRERTSHGQEGTNGPRPRGREWPTEYSTAEGDTHREEEQHHRRRAPRQKSTTQEEHTRRAHHRTQLKSTGEEHNK